MEDCCTCAVGKLARNVYGGTTESRMTARCEPPIGYDMAGAGACAWEKQMQDKDSSRALNGPLETLRTLPTLRHSIA